MWFRLEIIEITEKTWWLYYTCLKHRLVEHVHMPNYWNYFMHVLFYPNICSITNTAKWIPENQNSLTFCIIFLYFVVVVTVSTSFVLCCDRTNMQVVVSHFVVVLSQDEDDDEDDKSCWKTTMRNEWTNNDSLLTYLWLLHEYHPIILSCCASLYKRRGVSQKDLQQHTQRNNTQVFQQSFTTLLLPYFPLFQK